MFFWSLVFLLQSTYSIRVGIIRHFSYQSDSTTSVILNGTCEECVCQAFLFNTSFTSVAFNCYTSDNVCHLFRNFSTPYQLVANTSSQFFFYPNLPPLMTLTTSTLTTLSSTTPTTSFPVTLAGSFRGWNSTGTTVAGLSGSPGRSASQLWSPFGLTLDSSNTMFIADRGNNRVQRWLAGATNGTTVVGQQNGATGAGLNYLNAPGNVQLDPMGNIYVTEIFNYRVLYWLNGALTGTLVAGTGNAGSFNNELNQPHDIAYDWGSGILYISEYSNHRVMQYLPNASSGNVVAGGNGPGHGNTQLYNPVGLYYDAPSNSLFIANYGAHNIVRWIVGAGSWTLVAGMGGSPGSTSTLLQSPGDVTLDSMGNVYVADTYNHRIQFFLAGQPNGTTIAGITLSPGSTPDQLTLPFGVTVDSQFNVYVADYGNHRVQKFLYP